MAILISPFPPNWAEAVLSAPAGTPVCLVVIADVKGSAPRETGAMMLVHAGHIQGSIGGGELEYQAIDVARSHQPETGFERQIRSYPLGPSLGQCCGGHVKVMFEWYQTDDKSVQAALAGQITGYSLHDTTSQDVPGFVAHRPTPTPETACVLPVGDKMCDVFIYGAGHVGRAVVELARHLACQIFWVDTDEDRFPEVIPQGVTKLPARHPQTLAARAPDKAIHLVMTYSHQLDYDIISVLLNAGGFARCGLIGSKTKAARFRSRLQDNGLTTEQTDRLVCPIGIEQVTGKAPLQVALSITAQLSNWLDEGRAIK